MKCEEFRDIVFELASGELDETTSEAAKAHMADCSRCREEYRAAEEVLRALKEAGEIQAPPELLPNVMNAVRNERVRRRFEFMRFAGAAAAALVLVVGAVKVLPGLVKDPEKLDVGRTVNSTGTDSSKEKSTIEDVPQTANYDIGTDEAAPIETIEEDAVPETVVNTPETAVEASPEAAAGGEDQTLPKSNEAVVQNTAEKFSRSQKEETASSDVEQSVEAVEPEIDAASVADTDGVSESAFSDESGESADALEDLNYDDVVPANNNLRGRGGGGGSSSGGSDSGAEAFQIITAGIDDVEPIVEAEERTFVHRTCRFTVAAEFAEAVKDFDVRGKTMTQVADALDALGVTYDIYVVEDEYTDEYRTAGALRREEIETLCAGEDCEIVVEE